MTPAEYLAAKHFKVRPAPGEWQTPCPFCDDKNKSGHLYVNRDHGAFFCHRCGENGSFHQLQERLGDRPELVDKSVADKWRVWASVVEICQENLVTGPESGDVLSYLKKERGLSPKTIGKYRLGWVGKDLTDRLLGEGFTVPDIRNAGLMTDDNYPVMWDRILIPYFERNQVVTLRGKQIGGNVIQAKDTSVRLFTPDNLRGHKEVFVCEGEFDAMLLDQLGFPAVAIPGALSFQEHWVTWFDEARRVFVCLDADDAGRKGTARIQAMVGNRVRVVEFPVPDAFETTDVTEFFLRDRWSRDDFVGLVDEVRGQRLFFLADAIRERDEIRKLEGLTIGWPVLDAAIEPGFLPGQVVTVLAKTGAGKTALLSQIAHNLSSWQPFDASREHGPSIPTMILSLEQTKGEMAERLLRIGRFHNPWVSDEEMTHWYSSMMLCDENRIPGADVPVLFDEFVEEVGKAPRVIIVDYLGYWSRAFRAKTKYEQVSEAIMELKRIAKDLGVVIVAPHQVNRMGKRGQRLELDFSRDSGVVEETSDFVFGLFRPHDGEPDTEVEAGWEQRAEVRLEILKSRHGSTGRQVRLLWAPYSLALIEQGVDLERRIKQEYVMQERFYRYDDVLKVHQGKRWV